MIYLKTKQSLERVNMVFLKLISKCYQYLLDYILDPIRDSYKDTHIYNTHTKGVTIRCTLGSTKHLEN